MPMRRPAFSGESPSFAMALRMYWTAFSVTRTSSLGACGFDSSVTVFSICFPILQLSPQRERDSHGKSRAMFSEQLDASYPFPHWMREAAARNQKPSQCACHSLFHPGTKVRSMGLPFNPHQVHTVFHPFVKRRKRTQLFYNIDHFCGHVVDFGLRVKAAQSEADRAVRQIIAQAKGFQHIRGLDRRRGASRAA